MPEEKQTGTREIPLFPLSNLVMPDGLLPLRLFEPRYLDMTKHCFRTDSGFGVCLIEQGSEVGPQVTPYPRGTLVRIIDFDQGEDGLLHIVAQGQQEFELHEYTVKNNGLLVGKVGMLAAIPAAVLPARFDALAARLEAILRYVEPQISYPQRQLDDAVWVCNRLLELLPLDADSKFRILLLPDVESRLAALDAFDFRVDPS